MLRNNDTLDTFLQGEPTVLLMDWIWGVKQSKASRVGVCVRNHVPGLQAIPELEGA